MLVLVPMLVPMPVPVLVPVLVPALVPALVLVLVPVLLVGRQEQVQTLVTTVLEEHWPQRKRAVLSLYARPQVGRQTAGWAAAMHLLHR